MKEFLKLIRVKHYIKNILIFLPIIFSKNIFKIELLTKTIIAFIIFSLTASIIYVFNDLMDIEKDKIHPKKKNRPLASGRITKIQALITIVIFTIIVIWASVAVFKTNIQTYFILIAYLIINVLYSFKLKNMPIVDVTLLATGYLLRVLYGACVIGVPVSQWLYLTILSISFYMGMGKRRNEISYISTSRNTREVLKYYTESFLDKNMYMCLCLAIVFYSLWCLDMSKELSCYIDVIYTIPIVLVITMKYSLNIEKGESTGDPVEVILSDKVMLILLGILGIMLGINYI